MKCAEMSIAIGPLGCVLHLIWDGALATDQVRLYFVLDEADEMLEGFQDELHEIFRYLPAAAQVALFSATLPAAALEISARFMRDPLQILVKQDMLTLDGINQFYIDVERDEWKLDTLCDLYDVISTAQTMIFVNSRRKAGWLADCLDQRGHTVSLIHGELDQRERDKRMQEFRTGSSRMLISTDVLGRGIDVQQVGLVVNYDLPRQPEPYLHRIGRSGRFGKKGAAINLITQQDVPTLQAIERHFNTEIKEMPANIADLL